MAALIGGLLAPFLFNSEENFNFVGDLIVKTDESDAAPVIEDADVLKEAFKGYATNSKLLANIDAFLQIQNDYKVNAIFAAAVAIDETTAGTAGNGSNGACNWFNYSPAPGEDSLEGYLGTTNSGFCKWDTDAHGIIGFGYYIANSSYYFKKGVYGVQGIGEVYCADPPPPEWANNVLGYMVQLYAAAGIDVNPFALSGDFYNADGSVDETKMYNHMKVLESYFGLPSAGSISTSWQSISVSGYTPTAEAKALSTSGCNSYQCTWWANVRANYFLKSAGKDLIPQGSYGNGKYVAGNLAKYFKTGSTPRPNSVFSMTSSSGYGHVAYVEAVDNVNGYYYVSHCGSGKNWHAIQKVKIGTTPCGTLVGQYVYLDQPK